MTTAPSQAVTHLGPADPSPKIAKLGDRFLATLLDTMLVVSPILLLGELLGLSYGMRTPEGFNLQGGPALFLFCFGVALWFCYFWASEGVLGRTVGKFLVGIRVEDQRVRELRVGQAYFGTLLRFIDGVGFYLVGLLVAVASEKHQRLGDRAAKTLVPEVETPPRKQRVAALLALIAVVIFCYMFVILIRHM
jgi:uncharacterized RDD family membrane protein YckC